MQPANDAQNLRDVFAHKVADLRVELALLHARTEERPLLSLEECIEAAKKAWQRRRDAGLS